MAPKKKELFAASVYTRIRPYAKEGEAEGHGKGEAVEKELAGFEDGVMLIKDSKGTEKFNFPKQIFGPETTQEQVFASCTPELLDGFLEGQNHALLFAYGQTGTGKTHTMFGPSESLSSPTEHPDWGLLPRIIDKTFTYIKEHPERSCSLAISAVELYCFAAWDLNAKERNMVTLTTDGDIYGHTFTHLNSVSEMPAFIDRVYGNRKVASTKMNKGSSRSHVIIMLTLYQVDNESGQFRQTEFSVVDLAGSERPGKTGKERMSANEASGEAMQALISGKELSPGAQGSLINFELTQVTTAFTLATEAWSKGKKYKPQTALVPPGVWYLGGCCTGHARLGVVVGISQSPQNGWETWFSCTWGANAAKLKAPCNKQKAKDVDKELKSAEKEKKAAEEAVAKADPKSASSQKYAMYRAGMVAYTTERLTNLQRLVEMRAAAPGGKPPNTSCGCEEGMSKCEMEMACCELRSAFSNFDTNGDGSLDVQELVAILSRGSGKDKLEGAAAEARAKEIIANFDLDQDGRLQMEEFVQWWKSERFKLKEDEEEAEA